MCIFNFVSKCFKTISTRWIPKIAEAAGKLRVGPGNASETDVGPLISKQVGEDGRKMGGFLGVAMVSGYKVKVLSFDDFR